LVSRSPLVDRGLELDALEVALASASNGEPQVALVEGEPGIGKSALLRAFRGAHQEITSLTWSGDDTETQLSLAMLDQLVETTGTEADPFTAGAGLLTRLGELTSAGPVLLVLDDAHLADRPSLVALNFAVRRLRHDPVLVVLSARATNVSDLPASIVRMAADADRRIVLPGLTRGGVQRLAGELGAGQLSRRAAERLAAATNGNPLHLRALLVRQPTTRLAGGGANQPPTRSGPDGWLRRGDPLTPPGR
jgi:predicted ATPase